MEFTKGCINYRAELSEGTIMLQAIHDVERWEWNAIIKDGDIDCPSDNQENYLTPEAFYNKLEIADFSDVDYQSEPIYITVPVNNSVNIVKLKPKELSEFELLQKRQYNMENKFNTLYKHHQVYAKSADENTDTIVKEFVKQDSKFDQLSKRLDFIAGMQKEFNTAIDAQDMKIEKYVLETDEKKKALEDKITEIFDLINKNTREIIGNNAIINSKLNLLEKNIETIQSTVCKTRQDLYTHIDILKSKIKDVENTTEIISGNIKKKDTDNECKFSNIKSKIDTLKYNTDHANSNHITQIAVLRDNVNSTIAKVDHSKKLNELQILNIDNFIKKEVGLINENLISISNQISTFTNNINDIVEEIIDEEIDEIYDYVDANNIEINNKIIDIQNDPIYDYVNDGDQRCFDKIAELEHGFRKINQVQENVKKIKSMLI